MGRLLSCAKGLTEQRKACGDAPLEADQLQSRTLAAIAAQASRVISYAGEAYVGMDNLERTSVWLTAWQWIWGGTRNRAFYGPILENVDALARVLAIVEHATPIGSARSDVAVALDVDGEPINHRMNTSGEENAEGDDEDDDSSDVDDEGDAPLAEEMGLADMPARELAPQVPERVRGLMATGDGTSDGSATPRVVKAAKVKPSDASKPGDAGIGVLAILMSVADYVLSCGLTLAFSLVMILASFTTGEAYHALVAGFFFVVVWRWAAVSAVYSVAVGAFAMSIVFTLGVVVLSYWWLLVL